MEKYIKIDIILDGEGFIDCQCNKCSKYFKLKYKELEDFKNHNPNRLTCLYCGLSSDNFITEEYYQLAYNKVNNYMNEQIEKIIGTKIDKKSYLPEYDLKIIEGNFKEIEFKCCSRKSKVNIDISNFPYFCAYCGGVGY